MANARNDGGAAQKKSMLQKLRERDFPGIKKDIDESIYENVAEPMYKAGYETAGPAVGAAMGAAADFALPDDMTDVGMMAMGPVSKVGKAASAVRKLHLDDLKKVLPPEKLAKIAEEVRVKGFANLFDEAGKMLGTVGEHSDAGKLLKAESKAAVAAKEAASPAIDYGNLNAVSSAAPKVAKAPKVSGEAAEFYQRTGVDPTRKTALKTIEELRAKRKAEELKPSLK